VLNGMNAEEAAAIHSRAGRLLYQAGAAAASVAAHLVAANRTDETWAVPVLEEAAEQALYGDRLDVALNCLRLAERAAQDERQRAGLISKLMRLEWRVDPATAARHLPTLVAADREGHLGGSHAAMAIYAFLWLGRPAELARRLPDVPSMDDPTMGFEADVARLWMAFTYPELFNHDRNHALRDPQQLAMSAVAAVHLVPTVALATVSHHNQEYAVALAEQILQQCRLDDTTLASIAAALCVLVHTERLDRAAFWCDTLIRSTHPQVHTWQGVLFAIRAVISVRQGDVTAALNNARTALARIPARSWGVVVGLPLAVSVLAATASAQFDEATSQLSLPVPEVMFQTPFGLIYVYARGRYNQARHRHYAALSDFRACGELAKKSNIDQPLFLPWRGDAAEACLALGMRQEAQTLVAEQLSMLGGGPSRAHAMSMRVLAATAEPIDRLPLLRQAVEELENAGDQLELATALSDLSRAHHVLGERRQARTTLRRAHQIARQCGAELLRRRLDSDAADRSSRVVELEKRPGVLNLSDAERRVAVLAAQGHSNRQIAGKLYVSVSTVEQHLTRVYRKLKVTRRADLPLLGL
jgi:DNA-binding CsgD family transcriptional regulator